MGFTFFPKLFNFICILALEDPRAVMGAPGCWPKRLAAHCLAIYHSHNSPGGAGAGVTRPVAVAKAPWILGRFFGPAGSGSCEKKKLHRENKYQK